MPPNSLRENACKEALLFVGERKRHLFHFIASTVIAKIIVHHALVRKLLHRPVLYPFRVIERALTDRRDVS